MPILVKENSLVPLSEYIKIQIEPCDELPEKNTDTDSSIMDKINKIFEEEQRQAYVEEFGEPYQEDMPKTNRIMISLNELLGPRPKKNRKNLSFKNTSKTMSKYTMKNYQHINSNTSDVDHAQLQVAEELGLDCGR